MNAESKTLLAIIAVVLMLGCALVPPIIDETKDVAANGADETERYPITEFLDSLLEMNSGESKTTNAFFIPVETSKEPVTPLGTDVKGPVSVPSGIVGLNGDYVFETDADGNKGSISIEKGATLALFPNLDSNDFSLTNKNGPSEDEGDLITMKSGSRISLYKMTFELIGSEFVLVAMNSLDDKANKCTFSFVLGALGHSEFKVNASEGLKMTLAELMTFDASCDRDVIVLSGNFLPVFTGTGFSFSGSISLHEISGKKLWSDPSDIRFAVNDLTFSYVPRSTGANVKLSMSVSTDDCISLALGRYVINGFAFETGDISLDIARSNGDKTLKLELSSPSSATVRFGNGINAELIRTKDASFKIAAKNLSVGFDVSGFSSEFGFTDKGWIVNGMNVDGNISLTCEDMDAHLIVKNISAAIMFTGSTNIDSLHYGYDGNGYTVTVGRVASSGVASSMELRYSIPKQKLKEFKIDKLDFFVEPLYGIESDTNVTNVTFSNKDGTTNFGFDELRSDLRAVHGSPDWNGEVLINGLKVSKDSVNINRAYIRNDFPMQQVLSGLQYKIEPNMDIGLDPKDVCIPTIGAELRDFVYEAPKSSEEPKKIGAGYVRIDVKEYRDIEEFSIEFSENVMMTFGTGNDDEKSSIMFDSSGVSGFVKNADGERNGFSITSSPKVALELDCITKIPEKIPPFPSIDEILEIGVSLDVRKGNAKFDGGVLPFGIRAGSGTTFIANGLTAAGFVFDNDCSVSGTVAIDTNADLSMLYNKNLRVIRIGDDYALIPDTDGYVIGLDFSKRNEGTLVANDGSKLPASFEKDGFSMRSADNRTGTFTVGPNGAIVKLECIREEYNLTYEGISESYSYAYGTPVTLSAKHPMKPGVDFYGWNDGTRIYGSSEIFVMPSHDVTLRPVFIDTLRGIKTIEDSKTILVVESLDADLVRVNVTDLEWDLMRVTVGNTTFTIDVQTFMKECYVEKEEQPATIKPIMFQSVAVDSDRSGLCCDLKIYVIEEDAQTFEEITKSFHCSGNTVFDTTVNMKVNGNVKGFNVYEIDYKGNLVAIDDVTFTHRDNGTYDVSFTIGHGAQYVIEPIYDSQSGILITIVIVIALICAFGICLLIKKYNNNPKVPTESDGHE